MSRVRIFHNPRCSKSRQTLALLEERGVDVEIVEYLKDAPDRKTVQAFIEASDSEPREFVRTGDAAFKDAGLTLAAAPTVSEVARLIAEHPAVLQRPVVVAGKKARIGRPPEKVLEIL